MPIFTGFVAIFYFHKCQTRDSNTGMKGRQENKMIKKGKDISDQFKGNGKCEVICEKNKKTLDF